MSADTALMETTRRKQLGDPVITMLRPTEQQTREPLSAMMLQIVKIVRR